MKDEFDFDGDSDDDDNGSTTAASVSPQSHSAAEATARPLPPSPLSTVNTTPSTPCSHSTSTASSGGSPSRKSAASAARSSSCSCSSPAGGSSMSSKSTASSRRDPALAVRRTRNQRLRAKGIDPQHQQQQQQALSPVQESPNTAADTPSSSVTSGQQQQHRHVRFSLRDDDAFTKSVPSPASAHRSTRRRGPPVPRNRVRLQLTSDDWGDATANGTANANSNAAGGSAAAPVATRSHVPNRSVQSLPPFKVRGAGRNVYAVQDSARARGLSDECHFLCGTLTTAAAAAAAASSSSSRASTSMSAVQAGQELATLLSVSKNRSTLWSIQANSSAGGHDDFDNASTVPLQAILDVVASVPTSLLQQQQYQYQQHATMSLGGGGASRTKSSRQRQEQDEQAASVAALNNATAANLDTGLASTVLVQSSSCTAQTQLLEAVSLIVYYLSLDCTLDSQASSKSARVARRIRRAILTHPAALQGILHLVLADPIVDKLRGRTKGVVALPFGSPVAAIHVPEEGGSVTSSVGDSLSNASHGDTPDSQSSLGSADPTLAGRRRRKKRRLGLTAVPLDSIPEVDADHGGGLPKSVAAAAGTSQLSFASTSSPGIGSRATGLTTTHSSDCPHSPAGSTDSHAVKVQERLDRVKSLVLKSMSTDSHLQQRHTCGAEEDDGSISCIALIALARIIAGKNENDEQSCIDDGDDEDDGENGDEDDGNPLLQTNRLLGENGAVPWMAQAIADALAALTKQISRCDSSDDEAHLCDGCLHYLHDRVAKLATLVDGACLFNEGNRRLFCREGFTTESNGYLVVGLIAALKSLCDSKRLFEADVLGEIGLNVLRTLTSLSHENEVAAKELEASFSSDASEIESESYRGLDVLVRVLKVAVDDEGPSSTDKLRYDGVIFCLNTLTNVIESGGDRHTFAEMKSPGLDSCDLVLTWLARCLVRQTASFRDAVIGSTFGSSPTKHASRQLDSQEDEKLVTAGNGFVLLTCLMIDSSGSSDNEVTSKIRNAILEQIPGDDSDASMMFIINTLKAFCNFYHFSVGDLSVAVVAPVKKLIQQLEVVQGEMKRPAVVDDASTVCS